MVGSSYSKLIKQSRIRKNMSQQDLADALGVTHQSISLYEQGKVSPSNSVIKRLLLILKIDSNNSIKDTNKFISYIIFLSVSLIIIASTLFVICL